MSSGDSKKQRKRKHKNRLTIKPSRKLHKKNLKKNKKETMGELDQKRADQIFRDINCNVNGFYTMNYLAYWSLRAGGFVAWNGHRKRNAKIKGVK